MRARQTVVKARTKPQNTTNLYNLLANISSNSDTSNNVRQRVTTSRTRSDGKAKGVAVRKKNV